MNRTLISAGAVALWGLCASPLARAAELNVIRSLDLGRSGSEARLVIAGNRAPTFTVFKLNDPPRLVVDLAGADVSAVKGPHDGQGPVQAITASQFSDEKASIGRIVLALTDDAKYDVKSAGNDVLVSVNGGVSDKPETPRLAEAKVAAPPSAKAEAAPAKEPEVPVIEASGSEPAAPPAEAKPALVAAAEEKKAEAPNAEPVKAGDGNVVAVDRDEKDVAHPAHRLLVVKAKAGKKASYLDFVCDGEVSKYELIELSDPPRLALDLYGLRLGGKLAALPKSMPMKEIRAGAHTEKLRVVLDAKSGQMPGYRLSRTSRGLMLTMVEPEAAKMELAQKAGKPAKEQALPIKDVAVEGGESRSLVKLLAAPLPRYAVSHPDPNTAVLTFSRAQLGKKLERTLDASSLGGPVRTLSSFSVPGTDGEVRVVAAVADGTHDEVLATKDGLRWVFTSAPASRKSEETATNQARAASFAAEAPAFAASGAPEKGGYSGRRVSFEFKDIDIHNLLRIIAEVSKRNVIVADDVTGKVTIRLRNVPWDQALDLILKTKGLDKEVMGNIIRVAPLKVLEDERKSRAEAEKSRRTLEPLKVRLIPVNYATASGISDKVKDLLSERGTLSVDSRTNAIIVKDTVDALARAEGLIRSLDTQTPQVLIESRIIEANSSFTRELGVQWGGNVTMGAATGNPTGLIFPNLVSMKGASPTTGAPQGVSDTPNFAVNLPAAIGEGSGGGLGFIFGSAGGAAVLNLRLTAFENQGEIKTISAPKVATLDNNEATIGQGVSIPFSQVSASGVNTTFVEAKLQLKVKPHVTADGSVLLTINASNNQPDPGLTGANGQPSISKKEATTEVLVKDGDTTVIGGIYTRTSSQAENMVPVLSKIPVLGWFFTHKKTTDSRTELLIFVTPRIINRQQIVAGGNL